MNPWDLDAAAWRALLQRFLALPTRSRELAMSGAADLIAEVSQADKVDSFVYDERRDSLVALGTSHQPLSALQRQHGLDVLALANGGRCVEVYKTALPFCTGQLELDLKELPGIRETLGVRSQIAVPIRVGEKIEGVLALASRQPQFWDSSILDFTAAVANWVGIVSHRAQLITEREQAAREEGRRAAAEELVTVLAHDLRNYMAPLLLHLQVLARRATREGRARDLESLEPAQAAVARIDGLVTDLLDVARIDHGLLALTLVPAELCALASEVASALGTSAHAVRVESYAPVTALADVARLRQCLENLVANAISHSPPQSQVTITIARERRAAGVFARIEISDEGPGIPEHLLPRIFDRFVTSRQARGSGLGLGLYLAKAIVTEHHGDLTVSSKPGIGTRFILCLPCLED
jgi:two-component system, OmpR family, sensor kinase